ncbi:hypothetical protein CFIO01_11087 [Colletotrichum fioriniae PJ7]|uniref:DUF7918 domain-containing protein n=1 Tax=Colletotrichum fioriniae PJ7 TaxID=1445577 RepID=A0A010QUX4_9PEZI|nr:hypothetical protein CFIO01_11087 [Colletotrichum fioriniae PJ7]
MAVIDGLPEIEVSIRINGSEDDCIEYDDPDPPEVSASLGSATHTTSKVIESQVDARFSIHFKIQNRPDWIMGKNQLAVFLYVDGNFVVGRIRGTQGMVNETIVSTIDCVWDKSSIPGKDVRRHFKFAPIKTVDSGNDRFAADHRITKHLGIVEVIVYRVEIQGFQTRRRAKALENLGEVSERALKGSSVSHSTSFPKRIERNAVTREIDFVERDGQMRIARFFFRYKPKASLQIDGILPRDPSPDPSSEPSPSPPPQTVANLPLADIMRLAQERLEQLEVTKEFQYSTTAEISYEASCQSGIAGLHYWT